MGNVASVRNHQRDNDKTQELVGKDGIFEYLLIKVRELPHSENSLSKLLDCGGQSAFIVLIAAIEFSGIIAEISKAIGSEPDALVFTNDDLIRGDDIGSFELRAKLFSYGYVPLKQQFLHNESERIVYVNSSKLRIAQEAGATSHHAVSMTTLGNNGRFANQLWQYLFINLYGLRNWAKIQTPEWIGEEIFSIKNERPILGQYPLLEVKEPEFDYHDFWQQLDSPRDVDFKGFFQNVPAEWKPHRKYIKTLFAPKGDWNTALENTLDQLRRDKRTLVSIHVRRGDYLAQHHASIPMFRSVPTDWYRAKLGEMWPDLRSPILHVSTDEPENILPNFSDFEQVSKLPSAPLSLLPDHIRDFYLLRDAAVMLACNSSFSYMASLLADSEQRCFLPDFEACKFVPYDTWEEAIFWPRFMSVVK